MSGYDHEPRRTTRREYREERYEERDPRYFEASDSHLRPHPSRELVPRSREDSDLSVEEIRRDFPPPTGAYRDRRARSAEPGYDDYDDRRSYYSRDPRDRGYDRGYDRDYDRGYDRDRDYDRDYDRRSRKEESMYYEEEEKEKRRRTISKQEKIIAAIGGFALAVGGKELYDRHEAKQEGEEADVQRNPLASAALGAAGALAAYQGAEFYNKHAEKEKKSSLLVHKDRDGQLVRYEEEENPKEKKGRKNFLESALAAAGLGSALKALTGKGDDDKDKERDRDAKSDTRSRRGSRSRSRSKSPDKKNKIQQAAMASLIAGATEAFRVAKEPGGWKGEKTKRIFTAAAGAATIDAAQNPEKNQKLSLAESVIGGLVGNRVIHGSKKNIEEDKATGRSRSRSRHARDSSAKSDGGGSNGVSGLAALATAGLGAIGAKKLIDSRKDKDEDDSRSRSRARSRSRSGSRSPERKRSRSRSVVDGARRRLARLGIGNGPADDDKDAKDNRSEVGSPRDSSRHRRRRYSDEYDDYYDRHRSRSRSRVGGDRRRRGDSGSDTDLGDSDNDRRETTRKRGKQALTIGLAGVATIHAAHNVYSSMEKRNARQKAVNEGRLSEEEAKKLKTKAMLQDVAAVGIAALGIKGAISEVNEAREKSKELHEWKVEKEIRRQRRLARQRAILDREAAKDKRRHELEDCDYRTATGSSEWALSATPRGERDGRYEYDDGPRPRYADGNPYAGAAVVPASRVGYYERR